MTIAEVPGFARRILKTLLEKLKCELWKKKFIKKILIFLAYVTTRVRKDSLQKISHLGPAFWPAIARVLIKSNDNIYIDMQTGINLEVLR